MSSPPPPLYLDEDVSVVVAAILAARGFMAATVRDSKQLGRSDSEQLAYAAGSNSVLVTHNQVDLNDCVETGLRQGNHTPESLLPGGVHQVS